MDPSELGRLLKDHLSDYSDVKSVKVVRDAKNRVCAFIQCEVCFRDYMRFVESAKLKSLCI